MKPIIELIEVKPGAYVVSIDPNGSGVAVYLKDETGSLSLMRGTKRKVDKKKAEGKVVSIGNASERRKAFNVINGGLHEERTI